MAETIVIDASAGIAVIRGEPAGEIIRAHIAAEIDAELVAPTLFWTEVANVLIRRYGMSVPDVVAAFAGLDRTGVTTVEIDRAAVLSASAIAERHRLSVYDATYLALAERLDAGLLTLDARLAASAGSRVLGFNGEIREAPERYRLKPWIRWSDLDAYLDAVREVTIASAG